MKPERGGLYEPADERQRYLDQKVIETVQHAYKNAPAVKEKLDKAGIHPSQIQGIKDLEKIPITTKDELVELQKAAPPFGSLVTVPVNSLRRIYMSPGPIYIPQERGVDPLNSAEAFYAAGFREGDKVINTLQLQKSIKDVCRLKADKFEFVARGTIPNEHKVIVDERT